jgi:hypothetical protein
MDGKGWVGTGKQGDEVSFESLTNPLGFVGALVVGGNHLVRDARLSEVSEEWSRGLQHRLALNQLV